jgi:alpha-L-fucosidase
MKVNGEAIYGTTKNPLKPQPSWGRITQKGETLYLHVFDWPAEGKLLVPGLKKKIVSATVLATGEKIQTSAEVDGMMLSVPAAAPDPISSTIVLKLETPLPAN